MKENDENYFCRKLGSNPGPYDPETSALTTMPQSHRVGAKFECQCVSNCFFDINQTGSPIIIPRPACSYLAAGKKCAKVRTLFVIELTGNSEWETNVLLMPLKLSILHTRGYWLSSLAGHFKHLFPALTSDTQWNGPQIRFPANNFHFLRLCNV